MGRISNRVPVRVRCVDDPEIAGRIRNRVPVRVIVADEIPDDGSISNLVPVNVIEATDPQEIDNAAPVTVFPVTYADESWQVSNAEPVLVYVESGTLCAGAFHAFGADSDGVIKALVTGEGAATFARLSDAWVVDWEGLVKNCLDSELRFEYARRVENLYGSQGIVYVDAGTAGYVEDAANQLTISGLGETSSDHVAIELDTDIDVAARKMVCRVAVKGEGADIGKELYILFSRRTGGTASFDQIYITLTSEYQVVSGAFVGNASNLGAYMAFRKSGAGGATGCVAKEYQIEDLTGQADQNPSEPVSVGVESGQYHGAMADGVKYFAYVNAITVTDNVVDESGNPGTTLGADELDYADHDISDWFTNDVTLGGTVTAVDGTTLTANGIIPTNDEGSSHYIFKQPVISVDDVPYTYRFWAKKGAGSDWVYGRFNSQAGTWRSAFFDLDTPAVGTTSNCTAKITALSDGWYQCDIIANSEAGASEILYIFCADADGDINITAGDGSTVWTYIDFPQLRFGFADWRALFEPAATNLCDDSIPDSSKPKWSLRVGGTETLNNAVAPNGVNEMTLVECNGNGGDGIRLTYTGAASTDHVVSAYVGFVDNGIVNKFGAHDSVSSWEAYIEVTWTAGVPAITTAVTGPATNKSGYIEQINATTWRYVVGFTSSASISTSYVQFQIDQNEGIGVGVNLWGYDVIQGTRIVSSHIPTAGGPATRAADDGTPMFDIANFNDSQGTWIVDYWASDVADAANRGLVSVKIGASNLLYQKNGTHFRSNANGDENFVNGIAVVDNRYRLVTDFDVGEEMETGLKDIDAAGSFVWDETQVTYTSFDPATAINIRYGAAFAIRLRDLKGYTTRKGKDWVEGNL